MKRFNFIILILGALFATACDDQLELTQDGVILDEDALQSVEAYQKLLDSSYDVLRGSDGRFLGGRSQIFADLLANELDERGLSGDRLEIYNRSTGFFNGIVNGSEGYYQEPYIAIYRANTLLANIDGFADASEQDKNRLKGEALFLRAICHFDVVRLFAHPYGFTPDNSHAGIPLRTEPSQEIALRSSVGDVYMQVIEDLEQAAIFLESNSRGYGYATEWGAKGYLARVYFQMNDFENAFSYANEVIESGEFTLDDDLLNRFSETGTSEAIFAMVSIRDEDNRGAELTNLYRNDDKIPLLSISEELYSIVSVNENDLRLDTWYKIDNEGEDNEEIYITKYNDKTFMDVPLLHLTELKLIRAESAAEQGENLSVAVQDINDIRDRAFGEGNNNLPTSASASLIIETARKERRLEMVTEGNYLYDMKRIGVKDNDPDLLINGAPWNCGGLLLQFPNIEMVEGFERNDTGGC